MKFVHLQTILSRRHFGKRKFSHNKGFPTVKGFTNIELLYFLLCCLFSAVLARIHVLFRSCRSGFTYFKELLMNLREHPSTNKAAHPGFETLCRRHQKSKTGHHKKHLCPPKIRKTNLNDHNIYLI